MSTSRTQKNAHFRPIDRGGMVYLYGDQTKTFESKSPPQRTFGYEWLDSERIEILAVANQEGEPSWKRDDHMAICKAAHVAGAKRVGYRRYDDGPGSERWVWFDAETGKMIRERKVQ